MCMDLTMYLNKINTGLNQNLQEKKQRRQFANQLLSELVNDRYISNVSHSTDHTEISHDETLTCSSTVFFTSLICPFLTFHIKLAMLAVEIFFKK